MNGTIPCGCDPTFGKNFVITGRWPNGWFCSRHMGADHSVPKTEMTDRGAESGQRQDDKGNTVAIPGIKNSGVFETSASGMKRDANPQGAIDYTNILHGPMYDRWASHLTKAKAKYPDAEPGVPNWTLANDYASLLRFRESAFRHMRKWMRGDTDEDHASAVFFNINGAEYVKARLEHK